MTDSFIKDSDSIEVFHVIWASESNLNDGSSSDTGELQGETISSSTSVVSSGLTLDSESTAAVTIQGVTYAINTAHNLTLSGGTVGDDYEVTSRVTTSGGRVLDKTIRVLCRAK